MDARFIWQSLTEALLYLGADVWSSCVPIAFATPRGTSGTKCRPVHRCNQIEISGQIWTVAPPPAESAPAHRCIPECMHSNTSAKFVKRLSAAQYASGVQEVAIAKLVTLAKVSTRRHHRDLAILQNKPTWQKNASAGVFRC